MSRSQYDDTHNLVQTQRNVVTQPKLEPLSSESSYVRRTQALEMRGDEKGAFRSLGVCPFLLYNEDAS